MSVLWRQQGDMCYFWLASFDFFRRISSVTKLTSQMLMKFLIVSMSQTALELCCAGNLVYKSHSANTIRRRRGTRESGSREPFLTGRIVQRLRGSLPQKRQPSGDMHVTLLEKHVGNLHKCIFRNILGVSSTSSAKVFLESQPRVLMISQPLVFQGNPVMQCSIGRKSK